MKSKLILGLILLSNQFSAQQFKATSTLSKIEKDGLHSMLLTPTIRSNSNADLSDIRLFDKSNQEVPYYIWQDSREKTSVGFDQFTMISKVLLPNKSTTIVVENPNGQSINELILNVVNSNLSKVCDISGSNNQNQWFGLLDNHYLNNLENSTGTEVLVPLRIPLSNYRYFKIQINDTNSAPIDVLKIGGFKQSFERTSNLSITPISSKTEEKPNQKQTWITVNFGDKQVIDNVDFQIVKPNLFKRNGRILVRRTQKNKSNNEETYFETILEFELNSSGSNGFELASLFEKELFFEIDNEDNPPLEIAKINFSQRPMYLVADLLKDEKYTLKTGDSTLLAPNYDIANFRLNSIESLPTANFSEMVKMVISPITKNTNEPIWQKKWFLWTCIGLAGLVILFFSASLLKDMKQE